MATISVSTLPKGYENLERWIWAGRKTAPDSLESTIMLSTTAFGDLKVVCLASPASTTGPGYASYFFQAGRVPLLLELGFSERDPKKTDYPAVVRWMIERAELIR